MITRAWSECRLPVGSSASRSEGRATRARDADELLLAAGQLAGKEVAFAHDVEAVEQVAHAALALALGDVAVGKRHLEVFVNGEVVEQVVALENEAEVRALQFQPGGAIESMDGLSEQLVFTLPLGVVQAKDMQQGGFAGS
jgi:hypothetical protein